MMVRKKLYYVIYKWYLKSGLANLEGYKKYCADNLRQIALVNEFQSVKFMYHEKYTK